MSSSPSPDEGIHLRAQIVSPVSPQPLRFPHPSSVPVLENQMDPTFNDTSTYIALPPKPLDPIQAQPAEIVPSPIKEEIDKNMDEGHTSPVVQTSAGSDTDHVMSVDSNSSGNSDNQAPAAATALYTAQSDVVDHAPTHFSDIASATDKAEAAPFQVLSTHVDDAGIAAEVPTSLTQDAQQNYDGLTASSTDGPNVEPVGVNLQALLENISASANISTTEAVTAASDARPEQTAGDLTQAVASPSTNPPASLLPAAASLPPRPPKQESPTQYPHGSDIRQYHLHDPNASVHSYNPHLATNLRPPGNIPPPQPTAGAPGISQTPSGLPQPPIATFQQLPSVASQAHLVSPSTPTSYRQREPFARPETPKADVAGDASLSQEIELLFEAFLADERNYVSRGEWEKFPPGSRLFLGKLSSLSWMCLTNETCQATYPPKLCRRKISSLFFTNMDSSLRYPSRMRTGSCSFWRPRRAIGLERPRTAC